MSNLYRQLGPQGRALMVQSGASFAPQGSQPQDLDFLINELRNPTPDLTVNKILGYLYHYVPYIKQEHNLRVVISAFLSAPTCFNPPASYDENFAIIEVIRLIFEKKLKVSQPTLSIKEFYTVWLEELTAFVRYNAYVNSWKVLPIIAGIHGANEIRDELYTQANLITYGLFFASFDKEIKKTFCKGLDYSLTPALPTNITYLSLLSLAVVYERGKNIHDYAKHVSPFFAVELLMQLLFGDRPDSLNAYRKFFDFVTPPHIIADPADVEQAVQKQIFSVPSVRYMNKLAFVLEACLSKLPHNRTSYQIITWSLQEMKGFNEQMSALTEKSPFNSLEQAQNPGDYLSASFWQTLKQILFSEVIVFTGILTRYMSSGRSFSNPFLSNPNPTDRNEQVALKIVENLYFLHFILVAIGQGGFDGYNFVYYLSNELALITGKQYCDVTSMMVGPMYVNLDVQLVNNNYLMQTKIMFVLGLWENYMGQKSFDGKFAHEFIYQFCTDLVSDPRYQSRDLMEATHSVLLIYFGKVKRHNLEECINYVGLLIEQHPVLLSATQMSVAIETVGKSLMENPHIPSDPLLPDSGEEFLRFLYHVIQQMPSAPIRNANATFQDQTLHSAQPVAEILAPSTLSRLEEVENHNIVEQNNGKKPFEKLFGEMSKEVYSDANNVLGKLVKKPVPKISPDRQYQFDERIQPETVREAGTNCLIALVPYIPLSTFVRWLDNILLLIMVSRPSEKKYLFKSLWVTISENLDLNRCALAYPWWYEKIRMPENRPFMVSTTKL